MAPREPERLRDEDTSWYKAGRQADITINVCLSVFIIWMILIMFFRG